MEVEKILDAGSGILSDVMAAVESNHYQDLGKKISDRVVDATGAVSNTRNTSGAYTHTGGPSAGTYYRQSSSAGPAQGGPQRGPEVYTGTVEPTNRKDGVFHTNFADGKAFGADRTGAPGGNYQGGQQARQNTNYQNAGPAQSEANTNRHANQGAQNFSQGAYSSDAYRRFS
ncbi:MAG: hypothetical protein IK078_12090, partial [Lachnospiraceae bacterium]|nr:hypothetical protein [Lachnospiraceae bacterium]